MPNYPTLIPKTTTPTPETPPRGGIHLPALFSPDSATAQRRARTEAFAQEGQDARADS